MQGSSLNIRKSRRLRTWANRSDTDRISGLPDSVLCHILSYIPTKEAVATSLIARRWRHVWTALQILSFDDRLCRTRPASHDVPMPGFVDFVNEVLRCTHPGKVAKLSVYCSRPTDLSSVKAWVSSALMRNVTEIELYLGPNIRVELPEALYSSPSLEVLRLHSDFCIQVPSVGTCFPSVKSLSVHLESPDNVVAEKLFCSCPVLEELWITADLEDNGPSPNFVISSNTLRMFQLRVRIGDNIFTESDYTVSITAPNLKCLQIMSDILGSHGVHELHSLKEVILDIFHEEWSQVDPYRAIHLLTGINGIKFLTLSPGLIYAINHACHGCFPSFPELTNLEVRFGSIGWRVLPIILHSSPNLETLVLHKQCWFEFTEEQFGWIETESVPQCLMDKVKNIELKGVTGDDDELPVLEYLFKYARAVECMKIWLKPSLPKTTRGNVRRRILHLGRASSSSKIVIM